MCKIDMFQALEIVENKLQKNYLLLLALQAVAALALMAYLAGLTAASSLAGLLGLPAWLQASPPSLVSRCWTSTISQAHPPSSTARLK